MAMTQHKSRNETLLRFFTLSIRSNQVKSDQMFLDMLKIMPFAPYFGSLLMHF
jgi:hypothetical protein